MEKMNSIKNAAGNEYVKIFYNYDLRCVMDVWEGQFGTQDNFKKGLLNVINVMSENPSKYWIADLRKMQGTFDSLREWIATDIMPRAKKLGLEREAILIPSNVFSKLSTKDTIMKVNGVEIKQFDDYEDAVTWLESA